MSGGEAVGWGEGDCGARTRLLGLERLVQLLKLFSSLQRNLGAGGGVGGRESGSGVPAFPGRCLRPRRGAARHTCSLWLSNAFHVRQLRSAFIFFLAWRMRAAL